MTRDAVLIRTEGDFKWKELENKEKEQKSYTGHTQNLGPLVRSIPADWLEEIHILHLFFRLPLEEKDVNWVMKKTQTSSMSLQSSGSESCSLVFDERLGNLTPM